ANDKRRSASFRSVRIWRQYVRAAAPAHADLVVIHRLDRHVEVHAMRIAIVAAQGERTGPFQRLEVLHGVALELMRDSDAHRKPILARRPGAIDAVMREAPVVEVSRLVLLDVVRFHAELDAAIAARMLICHLASLSPSLSAPQQRFTLLY